MKGERVVAMRFGAATEAAGVGAVEGEGVGAAAVVRGAAKVAAGGFTDRCGGGSGVSSSSSMGECLEPVETATAAVLALTWAADDDADAAAMPCCISVAPDTTLHCSMLTTVRSSSSSSCSSSESPSSCSSSSSSSTRTGLECWRRGEANSGGRSEGGSGGAAAGAAVVGVVEAIERMIGSSSELKPESSSSSISTMGSRRDDEAAEAAEVEADEDAKEHERGEDEDDTAVAMAATDDAAAECWAAAAAAAAEEAEAVTEAASACLDGIAMAPRLAASAVLATLERAHVGQMTALGCSSSCAAHVRVSMQRAHRVSTMSEGAAFAAAAAAAVAAEEVSAAVAAAASSLQLSDGCVLAAAEYACERSVNPRACCVRSSSRTTAAHAAQGGSPLDTPAIESSCLLHTCAATSGSAAAVAAGSLDSEGATAAAAVAVAGSMAGGVRERCRVGSAKHTHAEEDELELARLLPPHRRHCAALPCGAFFFFAFSRRTVGSESNRIF